MKDIGEYLAWAILHCPRAGVPVSLGALFLFVVSGGSPASAQVCPCVFPAGTSWSMSAMGGATDHEGTFAGATVARRITTRLSAELGYGWTNFGEGEPDRHDISAALALELGRIPEVGGWVPTFRPTAEFQIREMGELSVRAARLGPVVGLSVTGDRNEWTLSPFVLPLAVYRRASFIGLTREGWERGVRAGLCLRSGRYRFALEVERVWTRTAEEWVRGGIGVFF